MAVKSKVQFGNAVAHFMPRRLVLVVDPNQAERGNTLSVLGAAGFDCLYADDGESAIPLLRSDKRIGIVLSEMLLSEKMDGLTLLDCIRLHFPRVVFIAATNITDSALRDEALRRGAAGFVTKPIDRNQFLAAIPAEPQTQYASGHSASSTLKAIAVIAVLAVAAWWLMPDNWRSKYAVRYQVEPDQVFIDQKPHNCDWLSAPLGDKHCHYDSVVMVYNPDGKVIDGTGVQVNAGGSMLSYDGGKTWQQLPPDQHTAKVIVAWERVEE